MARPCWWAQGHGCHPLAPGGGCLFLSLRPSTVSVFYWPFCSGLINPVSPRTFSCFGLSLVTHFLKSIPHWVRCGDSPDPDTPPPQLPCVGLACGPLVCVSSPVSPAHQVQGLGPLGQTVSESSRLAGGAGSPSEALQSLAVECATALPLKHEERESLASVWVQYGSRVSGLPRNLLPPSHPTCSRKTRKGKGFPTIHSRRWKPCSRGSPRSSVWQVWGQYARNRGLFFCIF